MRGEVTAIREHNKHRGAGKTIFQWPTEGGEKTKFIAWTVTPNPKEPTQVTPPCDPNKHEGCAEGLFGCKHLLEKKKYITQSHRACPTEDDGTPAGSQKLTHQCQLSKRPPALVGAARPSATLTGAVAKVTAGKGSVPDKRKSFSGRRVQGAVVKSSKGRTGTVLKSGSNFAPAKGTTASKHSTTRGNSRISGKKPTRSIKF
ncbi:hypothetical protein MCOR12_008613 [Pyricularia oryzae]|nr:hypothetical protein MCOR20_002689 [Pyricularia oryzae]KAI6589922.1 hypothetical protein MCOR12_008613 [Pyricularia oryzae]